jgi:hypothetical protein
MQGHDDTGTTPHPALTAEDLAELRRRVRALPPLTEEQQDALAALLVQARLGSA